MPRSEETLSLKKPPSEALAEENGYDDYCARVWFFLMTNKAEELIISEIVKPENRLRWINAVKKYIDCNKKPEVLFTADYSKLKFYR